jgi:hypothetical protein
MNPNKSTETTPWYQRVRHALGAGVALLMMPLVLVYGAIMTTNTLTHLRHSEAWFYALVWLLCAGMLLLILGLLCRSFNKHRRLALGQNFKPTKSH